MNNYDDIINLERPISKKHGKMSIADRAAQFAPFAALTGFGAIIKETARLTDERIELDEGIKLMLSDKLLYLDTHPNIEATINPENNAISLFSARDKAS